MSQKMLDSIFFLSLAFIIVSLFISIQDTFSFIILSAIAFLAYFILYQLTPKPKPVEAKKTRNAWENEFKRRKMEFHKKKANLKVVKGGKNASNKS